MTVSNSPTPFNALAPSDLLHVDPCCDFVLIPSMQEKINHIVEESLSILAMSMQEELIAFQRISRISLKLIQMLELEQMLTDVFQEREQIYQNGHLGKPVHEPQFNRFPRIFDSDKGRISLGTCIGMGATSYVYQALLTDFYYKSQQWVAVKMNRISPTFSISESRSYFTHEIDLLNRFANLDPSNQYDFVKPVLTLEASQDHLAIVEPLCQYDLAKLIRGTNGKGLSYGYVAWIGQSIINALLFLKNETSMAHCDVKPANILVKSLSPISVLLGDFGAMHLVPDSNQNKEYLITRYYRPPELIFNLPFSYKVDIWSVALVLFELHTSKILFRAENEKKLYFMIESLLGKPPKSFIKNNVGDSSLFRLCSNNPDQVELKPEYVNPRDVQLGFRKFFDESLGLAKSESIRYENEDDAYFTQKEAQFKNLLLLMLQWDPDMRPDYEEILAHPFFGG